MPRPDNRSAPPEQLAAVWEQVLACLRATLNDATYNLTFSNTRAVHLDGDSVLIRPGTYHEQVTVTKAIAIAGDGPREAVVWEGLAAPNGTGDPFALLLDHSTATLTNVTLNGMPSTLRISGGSPVVEGLEAFAIPACPRGARPGMRKNEAGQRETAPPLLTHPGPSRRNDS